MPPRIELAPPCRAALLNVADLEPASNTQACQSSCCPEALPKHALRAPRCPPAPPPTRRPAHPHHRAGPVQRVLVYCAIRVDGPEEECVPHPRFHLQAG